MADVLKYGWAYGGKQGQEMPVAADVSFDRKGGAFVVGSTLTAGNVMKLCSASTEIIVGWAEVPRAAVPGITDAWHSSTTSGGDKVHVITDPSAVFAMPAGEAYASLDDRRLVGQNTWITVVGSIQYADAKPAGAIEESQLFVVDVDVDEKLIYVRVNPIHQMA